MFAALREILSVGISFIFNIFTPSLDENWLRLNSCAIMPLPILYKSSVVTSIITPNKMKVHHLLILLLFINIK